MKYESYKQLDVNHVFEDEEEEEQPRESNVVMQSKIPPQIENINNPSCLNKMQSNLMLQQEIEKYQNTYSANLLTSFSDCQYYESFNSTKKIQKLLQEQQPGEKEIAYFSDPYIIYSKNNKIPNFQRECIQNYKKNENQKNSTKKWQPNHLGFCSSNEDKPDRNKFKEGVTQMGSSEKQYHFLNNTEEYESHAHFTSQNHLKPSVNTEDFKSPNFNFKDIIDEKRKADESIHHLLYELSFKNEDDQPNNNSFCKSTDNKKDNDLHQALIRPEENFTIANNEINTVCKGMLLDTVEDVKNLKEDNQEFSEKMILMCNHIEKLQTQVSYFSKLLPTLENKIVELNEIIKEKNSFIVVLGKKLEQFEFSIESHEKRVKQIIESKLTFRNTIGGQNSEANQFSSFNDSVSASSRSSLHPDRSSNARCNDEQRDLKKKRKSLSTNVSEMICQKENLDPQTDTTSRGYMKKNLNTSEIKATANQIPKKSNEIMSALNQQAKIMQRNSTNSSSYSSLHGTKLGNLPIPSNAPLSNIISGGSLKVSTESRQHSKSKYQHQNAKGVPPTYKFPQFFK